MRLAARWRAALINLGNQLSDQGRHREALAATEEGVALLRELAATDNTQRRNLGRALTGLGVSYGAMGRLEESLVISQEAAAMAREVAQTNPQYRLGLAIALNNLGLAYGNAGRREEALPPRKKRSASIASWSRRRRRIAPSCPTASATWARPMVNWASCVRPCRHWWKP